jgi:sortase A
VSGPRRARIDVALLATVLLLAAIAGYLAGAPPAQDSAAALGSQSGLYADALLRVPEAPPPTEATTTTPPTTVPASPTPSPTGVVLGTITIPKFGVTVPMLEGIDLWVIDQGSGHWPGTPMPGGKGNMVVAGHRTLYQRPFHRLDELVPGDQVIFDTPAGRHVYVVRGVVIVDADAVEIVNQNDAHTATLFACHPKGSASHRIVAKLRLVDANGNPVDPDYLLPPVELGTGPGPHIMTRPPGVAPPPPK